MLCFAEICATSITGAGLRLIAIVIRSAQDQLHHHARSEDVDLRNGVEPRAVAENLAALPIYPLPRTWAESKYCRDGGNRFRYFYFLDLRANHRSRSP